MFLEGLEVRPNYRNRAAKKLKSFFNACESLAALVHLLQIGTNSARNTNFTLKSPICLLLFLNFLPNQ